jgi:hypothetical protein
MVRILYLLLACTWFLKFLSYHHIWHDVRYHVILANTPEDTKDKSKTNGDAKIKDLDKRLKVDEKITEDELSKKLNLPKPIVRGILKYPTNVELKDILIFLLIPTLDFQLKYPYNKEINVKRFILRMLEFLL